MYILLYILSTYVTVVSCILYQGEKIDFSDTFVTLPILFFLFVFIYTIGVYVLMIVLIEVWRVYWYYAYMFYVLVGFIMVNMVEYQIEMIVPFVIATLLIGAVFYYPFRKLYGTIPLKSNIEC